jgi:hypothetical protein
LIDYRPNRCLPILALLCLCAFASASYGQTPLPSEVLTAIDAAPFRKQIDTFVDALTAKLAGADATAWGPARMAIIGVVGPTVSPGFIDQYADSLNTRLAPAAANPDARVRLNAAIVAARIASRANNGRLAGITEKLLHDNSDAVVLWALQAAKYIVPSLLQSNNFNVSGKLGQQAVQAAKDHVTGQIAEEAYRVLLLDATAGTTNSTDSLKNLTPAAITSFAPNTLAFFESRVNQYATAIHPQPVDDTWAATFFGRPQVWSALPPQSQGQVLTAMLNLIKGSATQLQLGNAQEMRDVLRRTAQAIGIIAAASLKNSALEKAAKGLSSISNDTSAEEIQSRIATLEAAIKALAIAAAP